MPQSRRAVEDLEALTVVWVNVRHLDRARVQKAEMRGIDIALQRLHPVAFALPAGHQGLFRRAQQRLERRKGRRHFPLPQIDVDEPAALGDLIGAGLYLAAEILVGRQIRHVEAIALGVELPAVIDAAQPALLVAPEEQRGAAMRAAVVQDADRPAAVAERDQLFAEHR